MALEEKALVVSCQEGNSAAFEPLYTAYVRKIYDFIYYKTRHKETAEDLTSLTFEKALDKISQCDPSESFKSWLYAIARNSVIDYYRRRRPSRSIEDSWDIADPDVNIIEDLDMQSSFEKAKKYLGKLSLEQRDIIFMRVWQEMPYKEIAQVIGKSEDNCKMIFSRAMARLRSFMPQALALMVSALIF